MCDTDDPAGTCLLCEEGYYVDKAAGTSCAPCADGLTIADGCFRCDADECLECLPGYYFTTDPSTGKDVCTACQLDDFNAQYSVEPNRCSRCQADAPDQCLVCDIGFLGSTSNPNSCELKCDDKQYPVVDYEPVNGNENVMAATSGCKDCHTSCKTCALGDSNDQCTSCPDGYYLLFNADSLYYGTCVERETYATEDSEGNLNVAEAIEIFVKNGWGSTDPAVYAANLLL